ncbi:MAG: transketolase [Acidimicrobiales bacterium]
MSQAPKPAPDGATSEGHAATGAPTHGGDGIEARAIATVRGLAMDMPHRAKSGHQGTAMALAPVAHVLYSRILRYDANDPEWMDRDRLVLSCGHASVLLYSYLHLTGQGLELDDLKAFRSFGSATPGHPEAGHTAGVEVTTGPLGQGLGNAVGLAIAERYLRARFGAEVCDHHTFVLASDGDLMEGLSHEAASLAGHLGLDRLIVVYDDNHITIDGPTELAFSDNTAQRFEAYGWHVEDLGEAGEDLDVLEAALLRAKAVTDRPSMLLVRTHIGFPSPKTDDHATHGYALFDEEIAETKRRMGLPADESFHVPAEVAAFYAAAGQAGVEAHSEWRLRLASHRTPELDAAMHHGGLEGWQDALPSWQPGEKLATRVALEAVLGAAAPLIPGLIGGGADLTGNTGTRLKGEALQSAAYPAGRQIAFGVREHAMAAAMVGMARHGGVIPFGGTFLVFSDYGRPSVRLAALSQAHALFVWSHDSVGVGEDGPTHQPIEQVAALRTIPGLKVFRPADANETAACFVEAIEGIGPSALILSRQNLPVLEHTSAEGVAQGAYVLTDTAHGVPDVVLIATGSEVWVCVEAAQLLAKDGIGARVVSMPCWELFEEAEPEYIEEVLPVESPILAVEAGVTYGWERWADDVIGIERFGESAPGDEVLARFGFTPEHVAQRARDLIEALTG